MPRLMWLLLLLPQIALAAPPTQLLLGWQFPHDFPGLTAFRLTVANLVSGQQDVLQVVPSVAPACGRDPSIDADTFCAFLPTCPPPGVYGMAVQAVVGDRMSSEAEAEQNGLLCHVEATAPCQCQVVPQTPPPAPTRPVPAPPTSPPAPPGPVVAPQPPSSPPGPLATRPTLPLLPTFPTLTPTSAPT
jgi:hypothetical protein